MRVDEWKKLYERAIISEFLPYFQYEDGLYFLKDGGVGLIFEMDPILSPTKAVYSSLENMLRDIPQGFTVQFIMLGSPDITQEIDFFKLSKKNVGQLENEVINSYSEFLEKKRFEVFSSAFNTPVRNFRVLVSVKYGGKEKVYSFFQNMMKKFAGQGEEEEIESLEKKTEIVKKVFSKVESALKSAGANPCVCDPDRLIYHLYPFFHMGRDYRNRPSWDGSNISDCLIENDFKMEVYEDYVKIDRFYGKSLCVKDYPERWSATDSFFYLGNPVYGTALTSPFMLVLNAIKLTEGEVSSIKRNAGIVLSQRFSYSLFPRLRLKHEDLTYAIDQLENKGEEVWYANLSLFVFGKDIKQLEGSVSDARSLFSSIGFRLEEDRYINHAVFLSDLPLNYDLTTHKFLGRGRALFTKNIVDLAPIYGDPGIFGKPHIFLLSPRGQLVGFDLFSTGQGGYNGFVVATTGAGKSVFLQWIALMYYLAGIKVRIIDIGGSYERFCKNFGGTYISVSYENPMCVNPFSLIENEEELNEYVEFLTSLFLLMGGSKDERTFAQQEKILRSYLEHAIKESYARYGKESCIDTVVDILSREDDPRVQDFVVAMRPYTSKGSYGIFFNGVSEVDLSNPIVVIDNTFIENMPELMDPLLMVFTFHVSREVYTSKNKGGLVCIIDEAHKFLGKPKIDVFVEQAYRRFRKDGGSIIMATQGFDDFMGEHALSRAGRAAVSNSFWQFFMMQNSASRNALKAEKRISLSEWEEMLMDSTKTVKGEYSEIFIKTEFFTFKLRLVLDSFLKAMFFTDPQIRQKIQELVNQGMSYREAVKHLEEAMK